ncbi:hypothetical protein, conserved [Trypanosoma cruzi]|uniref:G-patch domain-containing protein n=1 Tax=Trypanosoma cruzi (strain CL Brener) TaxID=353153 RepID=Q4D7X2_TRYCC|nr:hypothetical protein, conserved [Trypanosoma cruzi]EAN88626.1 hypothetical protein, conserved [Trypanosoma cruzi]|eukprot:XP_810477.1 hypothetical protein [Trypanosoma cruzi strain CL Brener]
MNARRGWMGPVAPATGQDAPVRLNVLLGMQMYRPPPFTPFMLLFFSFLACPFLCVCVCVCCLASSIPAVEGRRGRKMSSIAKRMLERHGWKEGMGLGKNAQGVSTYVKVVRRDPHTTTGLGHAADATQAPQASTFSVELDAVYADMSRTGKKKEEEADRGGGVNRCRGGGEKPQRSEEGKEGTAAQHRELQ